jgi:hypothetical protein
MMTKEDDQNKGTHTAVVGDFREPEVEGGLPTALVYENTAGFVNSVVLQLKMNGGTLSPYTRTGSGKQTKNVTDWLLEGRQ